MKKRLKNRLLLELAGFLILFVIALVEAFLFVKKYRNNLLFKRDYAQTLQYSSDIKFKPSYTPTPTPKTQPNQKESQQQPEQITPVSQPENPIPVESGINPAYRIRYPGKEYNNYVYYFQCDPKIASIPLPQGCNFCKAGCGPTTVAMILSTYIDRSFDPVRVKKLYEDLYYSGDYTGYLGCSGSFYAGAKKILQRYFQVTPDLFASNRGYRVEEVVEDLRKAIKNGYTVFVLAVFKAGGHFFWVIDVDDSGVVWALDSYYGYNKYIPLNENNYYPYPRYKLAFGIKPKR